MDFLDSSEANIVVYPITHNRASREKGGEGVIRRVARSENWNTKTHNLFIRLCPNNNKINLKVRVWCGVRSFISLRHGEASRVKQVKSRAKWKFHTKQMWGKMIFHFPRIVAVSFLFCLLIKLWINLRSILSVFCAGRWIAAWNRS